MVIEGVNIDLLSISKQYTDLIVKWRNSNAVKSNFIYQDDITKEIHNNWIDNNLNTGKAKEFLIVNKVNGKAVGCVFLKDIDNINEKAEFGIYIGEYDARGKGFGIESTKLICEYGFSIGLHKIILRVIADNTVAINSYIKAGFIQEAYLKDEVKIRGKYTDIILMAKFNNF